MNADVRLRARWIIVAFVIIFGAIALLLPIPSIGRDQIAIILVILLAIAVAF